VALMNGYATYQKPPLSEAAKAQAAAEKGGSGKVSLVAQIR
jgi:hypothetical protein